MKTITSPQNTLIKRVHRLQRSARARRKEACFVVEGVHLAQEAARAGVRPLAVLVAEDAIPEAQEQARFWAQHEAPVYRVAPPAFRRAAATETPQGVLLLLPWPRLAWPQRPHWLILVDGLQDPGNLGTILRTAWAVGVQGVLLTPGTVDPFNPKALRSGMGAQLHLPIRSVSWEALPEAVRATTLYLADAHQGTLYTQADFRGPLTLAVGSEAHGLRPQVRALPHRTVRLPMPGGAESLNAAVAAGVLLYEVLRQRMPSTA